MNGAPVEWESYAVYNPAAVVAGDGTVRLLYRAQGPDLTSRLGLAVSHDGVRFERRPEPVLHPADDGLRAYEWPRGCEDPRLVTAGDGTYVLTYTAYDGAVARLCVATSPDLVTWTKHGPAFARAHGGRYLDAWSKAGAVVVRRDGDRMVAARVNGRYWMYWNDLQMYAATSDDLIAWEPVELPGLGPGGEPARRRDGLGRLRTVLPTRPGRFDSALVEPGAWALLDGDRIRLVYNARNDHRVGDTGFPDLTYAVSVAEFDAADPLVERWRADTPLLAPRERHELRGQVDSVVFTEGMVPRGDHWLLYYGGGDSAVCVAELHETAAPLHEGRTTQ